MDALVVGIGHNAPPPELTIPPEPQTPEQVTQWLNSSTAGLSARKTELLAAYDRFAKAVQTIADEETQGRAAEFVRQLRGWVSACESRRKDAKKPFLEGGRTVDSFFRTFTGQVEVAARNVESLMTAYATALEDRRRAAAEAAAREEAARAAVEAERAVRTGQAEDFDIAAASASKAEEASHLAEASAADMSRVRGDMGATASLRTHWTFEVTDIKALARAVADGSVSSDLILPNAPVLGAIARNAETRRRVIPGVAWVEEKRVAVR